MLKVAATVLCAVGLFRVATAIESFEVREAPTPPVAMPAPVALPVAMPEIVPVAAIAEPSVASQIEGTFTSNWGAIRLHVDGSRVFGDYDYNGGHIEGTLSGNVIRYRWREDRGGSGRGVWVVGSTGELIGTWGANEDEVSGGGWNLTRTRGV